MTKKLEKIENQKKIGMRFYRPGEIKDSTQFNHIFRSIQEIEVLKRLGDKMLEKNYLEDCWNLVLKEGKKPMGVIAFSIENKIMNLSFMALAKSVRGPVGHQTKMMEELIEYAKHRRMKAIRILVRKKISQGLKRVFGFEFVGEGDDNNEFVKMELGLTKK